MYIEIGTTVITPLEGEGVVVDTPAWGEEREGRTFVRLTKDSKVRTYHTDALYIP